MKMEDLTFLYCTRAQWKHLPHYWPAQLGITVQCIRRGHYDKSSDYHLEIELRTFHCQWLFPILSIIWSKNLPNWSMLCVVGQQHVDSLNYRWSWSLKINDFTSFSVNIHVSGLHTHIKKWNILLKTCFYF